MRKAATYDELVKLEKEVNTLPRMHTFHQIEEQLQDFVKVKVFLKFENSVEDQLSRIKQRLDETCKYTELDNQKIELLQTINHKFDKTLTKQEFIKFKQENFKEN